MTLTTRFQEIHPHPIALAPHAGPGCGKGKLFDGFLTLRSICNVCGLQYSFVDAGEGPAIFVILIAGFIVVGAALVMEIECQPPFWVHALPWGSLTLAVTLGPLRGLKGLLIVLQYHYSASEGRLAPKKRQVSNLASARPTVRRF
jgi:uncharacterized protein (DUF983 family)